MAKSVIAKDTWKIAQNQLRASYAPNNAQIETTHKGIPVSCDIQNDTLKFGPNSYSVIINLVKPKNAPICIKNAVRPVSRRGHLSKGLGHKSSYPS